MPAAPPLGTFHLLRDLGEEAARAFECALSSRTSYLILTYRRYRQKVEFASGGPYWVDDPHFDLAHHMKRVRLPGRGGKEAFERFVGDLASEPLDFNHPLWTVHIVERYEGGAAVVLRWHHAYRRRHCADRSHHGAGRRAGRASRAARRLRTRMKAGCRP